MAEQGPDSNMSVNCINYHTKPCLCAKKCIDMKLNEEEEGHKKTNLTEAGFALIIKIFTIE